MEKSEKRILVVDDNPQNIQVIGPILRKEGYLVSVAMNGKQGLRSVENQQPDLILSDINMPEMNGFEFCQALKENQALKDIPVIFLTASDSDTDETEGIKMGAVDFIRKPINPPVVLVRVETHLLLQHALNELKKQNAILEENAKLREDVERMSRHDLKSPLQAIISVPGFLKDDPNITEDQKEMLSLIEEGGNKILQMINRSLDLYKMETGTYSFTPEPIDPSAVLKDAIKPLNQLASVKKIAVAIAEERSYSIKGEYLLVFSLFSNILKNAIEAAPDSSAIEVSLSQTNTETVAVYIANEGEVPLAIRETFFDKYATAGKQSGTGLGTYSARLIIEAMGGEIKLNCSHPGKTTIEMFFQRSVE